jgi:hypothetical protein
MILRGARWALQRTQAVLGGPTGGLRGGLWCGIACACVRACVLACVLACVRACVCVYVQTGLCGHSSCVKRRPAVFIAQPRRTRVRFALVIDESSAHLCRRCHLDPPHPQRAMGCPICAHVRDRRRRRHLRHRRPQRQHLLQGRLGEHRQRCGPDSGDTRLVLRALEGTFVVLRGYSMVL